MAGVDRHLEVRRSDLVEKAAGFAGRIDNIAHFGFESQNNVRLTGDAGGLAHTVDHVPPRIRRTVVRMSPPHAVRVTGAGAYVNCGRVHRGTCLRQDAQAPQSRSTMLRIRVAHVEGTGQAGDGDPTSRRFATNPRGQFHGDLDRHLGQAGADHAHLHTGEATGLGGVETLFQRAGGERGGEQDADPWGLRIHCIYPILPAGGSNGDGPGQTAEVTPAEAVYVRRHRFEPDSRNRTRVSGSCSVYTQCAGRLRSRGLVIFLVRYVQSGRSRDAV